MYLVFSTTNLPVSVLIRFFDRIRGKEGRVSHVLLMDNRKWILNPAVTGLTACWFKKFKLYNQIKFVFAIKHVPEGVQERVFYDMRDEFAGYSYDYKGFFGKLWEGCKRFLGFKPGVNPFDDKDGVDCSEAAAVYLKRLEQGSGRELLPEFTTSNISPNTLLEMVSNAPSEFKMVKVDEL